MRKFSLVEEVLGGVPTHKYLEILAALREECSSTAAGTRLAGERLLADRFDVSVMTIRQSLTKLAEEGWIRRQRGSGTFVTRPRRRVMMGPSMTSFTEDMQQMGLVPSAEVLRFDEIRPDWDVMTRLRLDPGQSVVLLERLRLADGEPMAHEIAFFPSRFKLVFERADLASSVHAALIASGTVPASTARAVRAVTMPLVECGLLKVPAGSPGLEIVDIFTDEQNTPVEFARSRYRFDRYEVLSRITR